MSAAGSGTWISTSTGGSFASGRDEADEVRSALGASSASVMVANEDQGGIPDPYDLGLAGYRTAWLCWTR